MGKQYTIYALVDTRDNQMKYVGATRTPLDVRLRGHIAARNVDPHSAKDAWLREAYGAGYRPRITPLEVVSEDGWENAERYWIAKLRGEGHVLLNNSLGGAGPRGAKHSAQSLELKKRVSREVWQNSDTRAKHVASATGKKYPDVWKKRSGENCVMSKLTWAKVHEIRDLYANGMHKAEIVRKFGYSMTTICNVIHQRTWKEEHYANSDSKLG